MGNAVLLPNRQVVIVNGAATGELSLSYSKLWSGLAWIIVIDDQALDKCNLPVICGGLRRTGGTSKQNLTARTF